MSAIFPDVVEIFSIVRDEFGVETPVSRGQFPAQIEHNSEVEFSNKGKRKQSNGMETKNIALLKPSAVAFAGPLKLREIKIGGVAQSTAKYDIVIIRRPFFGAVEVVYV